MATRNIDSKRRSKFAAGMKRFSVALRRGVLPCALSIFLTGQMHSLPALETAHAASAVKDEAGFNMSREQVLKLGIDKFEDVYTARTHDTSTLGMKRGYAYYVECRHADNDLRARHLRAAQRQQLKALHDALSDTTNAVYELVASRAGGGTMYGLSANGANAAHEDAIGKVIESLSHSARKHSALRRRANTLLAQTGTAISSLATPPKPDDLTTDTVEAKRLREHTYADAQQGLARLRVSTAKLPDSAWHLALHLRQEVKAALSMGAAE